jgi:hypothetical protein
MSIKNSNDTIGNRTRDLPVFSAVPQPTAPPRAPHLLSTETNRLVCNTLSFGDYFPSFQIIIMTSNVGSSSSGLPAFEDRGIKNLRNIRN